MTDRFTEAGIVIPEAKDRFFKPDAAPQILRVVGVERARSNGLIEALARLHVEVFARGSLTRQVWDVTSKMALARIAALDTGAVDGVGPWMRVSRHGAGKATTYVIEVVADPTLKTARKQQKGSTLESDSSTSAGSGNDSLNWCASCLMEVDDRVAHNRAVHDVTPAGGS